jgi:hypothetical protein
MRARLDQANDAISAVTAPTTTWPVRRMKRHVYAYAEAVAAAEERTEIEVPQD